LETDVRCLLLLLLLSAWSVVALGADLVVPAGAQAVAGQPFDAASAAQAWLDTQAAAQRAKTDAYFEGGYWLELWGVVITVALCVALLATGVSARLRQWAERVVRQPFLQRLVFGAALIALLSVLTFPWAIYTDFMREHQYGLANQNFAGWAGEAAIDTAITVVFGSLLFAVVYGVIRRTAQWWLWGTGVVMVFMTIGALIFPVYLAPLFNEYKPVSDARVRGEVLAMARAYGVPADEVYEFNASKQHKRISANVAGLAGTMRIALNDNLLQRASIEEIRMVMAHEIGHYVLNHAYKGLVFSGLVLLLMFWLARAALRAVLARWGRAWGLRGEADVAAAPILIAAFGVLALLAMPINRGLTRVQEVEADRFGLAASREPDGFAAVALKLGEYRKMAPTPLEEVLFYTHPSGARRIQNAMRWKAEHR
jgi:STE24 endopeptidase